MGARSIAQHGSTNKMDLCCQFSRENGQVRPEGVREIEAVLMRAVTVEGFVEGEVTCTGLGWRDARSVSVPCAWRTTTGTRQREALKRVEIVGTGSVNRLPSLFLKILTEVRESRFSNLSHKADPGAPWAFTGGRAMYIWPGTMSDMSAQGGGACLENSKKVHARGRGASGLTAGRVGRSGGFTAIGPQRAPQGGVVCWPAPMSSAPFKRALCAVMRPSPRAGVAAARTRLGTHPRPALLVGSKAHRI